MRKSNNSNIKFPDFLSHTPIIWLYGAPCVSVDYCQKAQDICLNFRPISQLSINFLRLPSSSCHLEQRFEGVVFWLQQRHCWWLHTVHLAGKQLPTRKLKVRAGELLRRTEKNPGQQWVGDRETNKVVIHLIWPPIGRKRGKDSSLRAVWHNLYHVHRERERGREIGSISQSIPTVSPLSLFSITPCP